MRVLLVDPDEAFAMEMAKACSAQGIELVHAASPEQMQAHMRIKPYDTVVMDLSLRRMNGFDVARELRMEHRASDIEIVLTSPRHKPEAKEIVTLKRDTEARFFFNKPIDYTAMLAALRTERPQPQKESKKPADAQPSPTVSPVKVAPKSKKMEKSKPDRVKKRPKIDWGNAKILIQLWLERKTGTVVVSGDRGGSIELADGGVIDDAGPRVLKYALLGGDVTFKEGYVSEDGDWRRTGHLFFKVARAGCDARTLRRYLKVVPRSTERTSLARTLPLGDDARTFMGKVDGKQTVQQILERHGLPVGEVSSDLVALVRMGLLQFLHEKDAAVAARTGVQVEASPTDAGSSRGVASSQARGAHESAGNDQVAQRLERELKTIENAAPAVVLGIPADAQRSLVDTAANRMRLRYAELIADRGTSAEVRGLALQIAKIVDLAHRNFNVDAVSSTGRGRATPYSDDVDEMLEEGRALIGDRQWAGADRVLSRAHEKRIDHVSVLSNLGWARLHNPGLDLETRTEEGHDFLLLAEQFDPTDGDGQYYLAQVLVAVGRLEEAEQRAVRALKAIPEDAARKALVRKIKVLSAQAESKAR
jgi:DNA-binding response OmpR family regulator